jgi:3-oxoacyl-[acyl-carrier-protein] synthase-3
MTNHDLEKIIETNDEWIRERTGIGARRIADDRDTPATLGTRASRKALSHADILPDDLDLIVVVTSSPAYFFPSTASLVQDQIGATHAGAFDLLAACTGFIYGLALVSAQIKSGAIDTALVIGTETLSRIMDWKDRGTSILFGDGAAAFVLRGSDMPGGVRDVVIHSDGSGGDLLYAASGMRPSWNGSEAPQAVIGMNGREVFRFATKVMTSATEEVVKKAGLSLSDIDLIVPHQANLRIIEAAARGLKLPIERFFINIEHYGNTSTASIPIAVAEAVECGRIKPNDRIVLVGFGGGLTWGAALIDWDVSPSTASYGRDALREGLYVMARLRSFIQRILRFVGALMFGSPTAQVIRAEKRRSNKKQD